MLDLAISIASVCNKIIYRVLDLFVVSTSIYLCIYKFYLLLEIKFFTIFFYLQRTFSFTAVTFVLVYVFKVFIS